MATERLGRRPAGSRVSRKQAMLAALRLAAGVPATTAALAGEAGFPATPGGRALAWAYLRQLEKAGVVVRSHRTDRVKGAWARDQKIALWVLKSEQKGDAGDDANGPT